MEENSRADERSGKKLGMKLAGLLKTRSPGEDLLASNAPAGRKSHDGDDGGDDDDDGGGGGGDDNDDDDDDNDDYDEPP